MRITLALALALTTTGCPFGDDDGDPGNYVGIGEIESAYRTARCTYLVRCGEFPDQATCEGAALLPAMTRNPVPTQNLVCAVAAGRLSYNGSNAKACLDAIANETCDRTDADGRAPIIACNTFFRATRNDGEACFGDEECVSQQCVFSQTSQTGTCLGNTPPDTAPAMIGQTCNPVSGCVDGAYCDSFDECVALVAAGQPCTTASECAYGLGCSGVTGTRTCKALPAMGQPCPEGLCRDEGLYCSSAMTCQRVGLPPTTCTSTTQCSPYYPCDTTAGQCKQGPAIGQPCSGSQRCFADGTFCDTASTFTCVAERANGQPCTSELHCQSGFCDFGSGTCAAPPDVCN